MATALKRSEPVIIEAFDAFVETKGDGACFYELVDGVILNMSNPTEAHEQIAADISSPLKAATDKRRCRSLHWRHARAVVGEGQRDRQDETRYDRRPRPCNEHSHIHHRPLVAVEVLSASSIDMDRGAKLDFHKVVPVMTHIMLVYEDQMRVEHDQRTPSGFELKVLKKPEGHLAFDSLGFGIDLASVYFGVDA